MLELCLPSTKMALSIPLLVDSKCDQRSAIIGLWCYVNLFREMLLCDITSECKCQQAVNIRLCFLLVLKRSV